MKEGDVSACLELFTEGGIYMWPNEPAIISSETLFAWFKKRFREYPGEIEKTIYEIVIMSDWAFERGNVLNGLKMRHPDHICYGRITYHSYGVLIDILH